MESLRTELSALSFGELWLEYEHLLESIRWSEFLLEKDGEDTAAADALKKGLQEQPLYEELLTEGGWDKTTNTPPREKILYCRWCNHALAHWDRKRSDPVCNECDDARRSDEYHTWLFEKE